MLKAGKAVTRFAIRHRNEGTHMEEKKFFGEYIRRKRNELGLTQKEAAERLFVTESTVSKWERGLSYPDVSMITAVCQLLNITEHEFFTACDDGQARERERAAAIWSGVAATWKWFWVVGYSIALAACFVCNLAISHRLDWFWIVLTALMLAACGTTLPSLIRRDKLPVCLGAATICLLLLLLACWAFVGERRLGGAISITAVCLALPWGLWALWRFDRKHVVLLGQVWLDLWVFLLLAVIHAFTGGGWLFSVAYPLALAGAAVLWLATGVIFWPSIGPWLKAGLLSLLAAWSSPLFNCLSAWLLSEPDGPTLWDYFSWGSLIARRFERLSWINLLVFAIMLAIAAVVLVIGAAVEIKRRKK